MKELSSESCWEIASSPLSYLCICIRMFVYRRIWLSWPRWQVLELIGLFDILAWKIICSCRA